MNDYFSHPIFKEVKDHVLERFKVFHAENPHVYELVKRFANEAKQKSRSSFGIAMIFERIRWYSQIETNDYEFKINNNHKSVYVRMLMIDDPFFLTMFQRRSQTTDLGDYGATQ